MIYLKKLIYFFCFLVFSLKFFSLLAKYSIKIYFLQKWEEKNYLKNPKLISSSGILMIHLLLFWVGYLWRLKSNTIFTMKRSFHNQIFIFHLYNIYSTFRLSQTMISILKLSVFSRRGKNVKFWSKEFCSKGTIIDNNYTVIGRSKCFHCKYVSLI